MNYEMVPFTHIKRRTALHSVLKSVRVAAVPAEIAGPSSWGPGYKDLDVCPIECRYKVDPDARTGTLRGFEKRFSEGDVFRSPSEMCEIFLVPEKKGADELPPGSSYPPDVKKATYDTMSDWWKDFLLTGDNAREMPYNHLVPRLTTRSNTYRVHYRVQVLKKVRSTDPETWDEARDLVRAETRGSALIERFIDPSTPLPDFAASDTEVTKAVDDHYQFRVLSQRRFY